MPPRHQDSSARIGSIMPSRRERSTSPIARAATRPCAVDDDRRGDGRRGQRLVEEQLPGAVGVHDAGVGHAEPVDERARPRPGSPGCSARRTAPPGPRAPRRPPACPRPRPGTGAHHEAQTLSTTTSPRWSDRANGSPSSVVPVRSGAASRSDSATIVVVPSPETYPCSATLPTTGSPASTWSAHPAASTPTTARAADAQQRGAPGHQAPLALEARAARSAAGSV